jgi:hypothetical protein
MWYKTILVTALALATSLPTMAQLDRGTITGSVSDSSGASIPGAQVTIISKTNSVYRTTTTGEGVYTMPNLPIGGYQVEIEAAGFKKFVRSNLGLGVTQVLRVDAILEVGAATEAVTVTAEVPRLQTDSPAVATSLSSRSLLDMPLSFSSARLPENFAYKIAPTVYGGSWTSYISGGTAFSKESLLDGAEMATNRGGHAGESSVSVESIQEFAIQTNGISAEFGRFQTGVFNYVLKSGTNEIHGSAFGALRNEAFNANTFVNNAYGRKRGRDRKFDYAGSFGGPVYIPKVYNGRSRSFFYATWERYWEKTFGFGAPTVTLPQPEFYDGDLSRVLGPATNYKDALGRTVYQGAIYDPKTFRQTPEGSWVGDMFPGNIIPGSRISAVSRKLNELMKQHYQPMVKDASGQYALINNSFYPISNTLSFNQYNFSVKGDQNINDNHKLSMSYAWNNRPRELLYGGPWEMSDPHGGPLAQYTTQILTTNSARLAEDWIISPRLLNHVHAFVNRTTNPYGTPAPEVKAVNGAQVLGIPNLTTIGYPMVNWGGGPIYGLTNPGTYSGALETFNSMGIADTLSLTKGRHFLKFGVDARHYQVNYAAESYTTFNFSALGTSIPNATYSGVYTGYSFASYLLGIVHNASKTTPVGSGGIRNYGAAFFQDDFKVSSRLTVNLGLRWDYNGPHFEVADRYTSWTPAAADPLSGLPGAYQMAGKCTICTGRRYFGNKQFKNFGPRLGFAWQAPKGFVVRAAYGIMYEGDNFNGVTSSVAGKSTQTAWGGTWSLNSDPITPWNGIFNWDSGLPQDRYTPAGFDPSWGNKNGPTWVLPTYGTAPYIQNWNFNVQREVIRNLVLEVGYIGNKGTRLVQNQLSRVNQLPTTVLSQYGTRLSNPVRSAADAAANGIAYPFPGFSGTVASALRQYPQVVGNNTVGSYGSTLGFSTFHSLQVVANRQFSKGLLVYANYTWSKTLANAITSEPSGNGSPLDYYNLRLEKAVSAQDVPQALKANISYELPIGKGKALLSGAGKAVNAILGGWSASAILNYWSGTPIGIGAPSAYTAWNGGTNRANIASGPMKNAAFDKNKFELLDNYSSANTYLNKSIYSVPAPLTLGSSAVRYAQLRTFATINEDLALQKNYQITEKYRAQLRVDLFNAFNRPTLSGPNTSLTSPLFGQITNVSGNRTAQVDLRLDF